MKQLEVVAESRYNEMFEERAKTSEHDSGASSTALHQLNLISSLHVVSQ